MRNIANDRIDAHGVFTSGGDVGFVATLVASVLPVLIAPLVVADVDVWTFWKSVGTILLGNGAAEPPTGFQLGAVLVGVGVHLFIGSLLGAGFAVLIAYFDVDTLTPTVVLSAFVLSVLAMTLTWIPLSHTIVPALDDVPIVFTGWMIVAFGILLGVGVQRWRQRWDTTRCPTSASTRRTWLLVAHERALVATAGTLLLVVAGLVANDGPQRPAGVVATYLAFHGAAALVVLTHTVAEQRERVRERAVDHHPVS